MQWISKHRTVVARVGKNEFALKPLTLLLGSLNWTLINRGKLLEQILRGTSDANISFDEMCRLLQRLGFDERIRGSHHIFTKEDVEEILNLQPKKSKAKPYQVKQVRNVIVKYKLEGKND